MSTEENNFENDNFDYEKAFYEKAAKIKQESETYVETETIKKLKEVNETVVNALINMFEGSDQKNQDYSDTSNYVIYEEDYRNDNEAREALIQRAYERYVMFKKFDIDPWLSSQTMIDAPEG